MEKLWLSALGKMQEKLRSFSDDSLKTSITPYKVKTDREMGPIVFLVYFPLFLMTPSLFLGNCLYSYESELMLGVEIPLIYAGILFGVMIQVLMEKFILPNPLMHLQVLCYRIQQVYCQKTDTLI